MRIISSINKNTIIIAVSALLSAAPFSAGHAQLSVNDQVGYLPKHHVIVPVGKAKYYYADGLYYAKAGANYVVVNAPIGAIVKTIPSRFKPFTLYGVTYYGDNGSYYVNTGHGYQVVPPPVAYQPPAGSSTAAPAAASTAAPAPASSTASTASTTETPDQFTINIPNDKGGFTAVALKRSGNGYVGPQGEYYDEFPKIAQLKVMYGK